MTSAPALSTRLAPGRPGTRKRIRWMKTSSRHSSTVSRRPVAWEWGSIASPPSSRTNHRSAMSFSSRACGTDMLSLNFIREHPDLVKEGARKKGEKAPVDEILRLDAERREAVTKLEQLKAEQNRRSAAMAKSRDEAVVEQLRLLRDEVKALEQRVAPIDARLNALLLEVPNPPDASVPEGKDANGNVTVRTWGIEGRKPPTFKMRPHYEIAERLGIIDFERAVKVTGSRFVFLKGAGARLERALINFMMDLHIREHGYTEILPPPLVMDAESVLQQLEIPYRVLLMCTGDMGFAQRKKYDLEAFVPGDDRYLEVSSCSNFGDFQARRANIRYREKGGKPQFVHTLNGSGLALPRTVAAIIENYQQEDGTIRVPPALRTYMGGLDVIR